MKVIFKKAWYYSQKRKYMFSFVWLQHSCGVYSTLWAENQIWCMAWNVMKRFTFEHTRNFTVFDDQDVKGLSVYVWIGRSWYFIMSPIVHRDFISKSLWCQILQTDKGLSFHCKQKEISLLLLLSENIALTAFNDTHNVTKISHLWIFFCFFKTIYWYVGHLLLALNWLQLATLQTIYDTNAQKQWQNRKSWRKRSAFTSWRAEKLQILSKCHVFIDLAEASHLNCLTWVRDRFPFSPGKVRSLWAEHAHSLPPSSCPVSQVHGEA